MTKIRHMAATLVSGLLPDEDKRDLARLMQHSSKTQQNTYNNCMATNRSIRMSKILRSICTSSKIESSDLEPAQFGTCYCCFFFTLHSPYHKINIFSMIKFFTEVPGYDIGRVQVETSSAQTSSSDTFVKKPQKKPKQRVCAYVL